MANTVLTADIIAKEALMILENSCVMGGLVYRGYEEEFAKKVDGYETGDTISVRRPTDFTVRDGRTASTQDVVEGKFPITVNKQKGVDFQFTSSDLSLKIEDLSERVIKPAMVQLGNQIDRDVMGLYSDIWNWVGTEPNSASYSNNPINSFADFAKGPERLDNGAVPQDDRYAVLSPTDTWAMLGSQTALYLQGPAQDAYRKAKLGMIGNVDTYQTQNVQAFTTGTRSATGLVNGASQSTTYAATANTATMTLITKGWTITTTIAVGDVFTIAGVFAVNPVTKATLSYLQHFVSKTTVTSVGVTTAATTLTISPPIITSGAFQTVSAAPADAATITMIAASASFAYNQNLVFHKNAFALVMVPMVKPPGAVDVGRRSYKGYSVRVVPYYDGTNDISNWRLDVLYGVKTIDARLATRISGSV